MEGTGLSLLRPLSLNTTRWIAHKQKKFFPQFWRLEVQDPGTSMVTVFGEDPLLVPSGRLLTMFSQDRRS